MNDELLEQKLRELPVPELPESWRGEILSAARREARSKNRDVWPSLLVLLRHLCLRNPVTSGAMATLWLLIFLLKSATPVDPVHPELLVHFDPDRPVHLFSIADEKLLAQLEQDQPEPQRRQIP